MKAPLDHCFDQGWISDAMRYVLQHETKRGNKASQVLSELLGGKPLRWWQWKRRAAVTKIKNAIEYLEIHNA